MCSGWESGQAEKWLDMKLQILSFTSTLCLQLIHPKTDVEGQRKLSVNLRPKEHSKGHLEQEDGPILGTKPMLFSLI